MDLKTLDWMNERTKKANLLQNSIEKCNDYIKDLETGKFDYKLAFISTSGTYLYPADFKPDVDTSILRKGFRVHVIMELATFREKLQEDLDDL